MSESTQNKQSTSADLENLVASTDTGSRNPVGLIGSFLAGVALAWALFQI